MNHEDIDTICTTIICIIMLYGIYKLILKIIEE